MNSGHARRKYVEMMSVPMGMVLAVGHLAALESLASCLKNVPQPLHTDVESSSQAYFLLRNSAMDDSIGGS